MRKFADWELNCEVVDLVDASRISEVLAALTIFVCVRSVNHLNVLRRCAEQLHDVNAA